MTVSDPLLSGSMTISVRECNFLRATIILPAEFVVELAMFSPIAWSVYA